MRFSVTADTYPPHACTHAAKATLGRRKILFNPLPIADAIELIKAAGGRAVIAHPPTLGKTWHEKFGADVGRLATEAALWGIEGFSSEISPENHILIEELAKASRNQENLPPCRESARGH